YIFLKDVVTRGAERVPASSQVVENIIEVARHSWPEIPAFKPNRLSGRIGAEINRIVIKLKVGRRPRYTDDGGFIILTDVIPENAVIIEPFRRSAGSGKRHEGAFVIIVAVIVLEHAAIVVIIAVIGSSIVVVGVVFIQIRLVVLNDGVIRAER